MQSSHPLIVGAGFDGTGLDCLVRALAILGKSNTLFPILTDTSCADMHSRECSSAITRQMESVMQYGFQNDSFAVSRFDGVDVVMGHPVPVLVWDFLEAFPAGAVHCCLELACHGIMVLAHWADVACM